MRDLLGYHFSWPENILGVSLDLACENKSELQQTVESNPVFWLVPFELKMSSGKEKF